jgi:beta-N-acetylhexosaminidase
MSHIWKIALLSVVVFVVGADKKEPETKAAKPPKADVRGTVKTVTALRAKGGVSLLIEGKKEKDTGYDKASVSVLAGATVEKWVDGKKVKAKVSDIKVGCKVQCVFSGPVLESLPVQASAKEVLILETPKK